MKELRFVPGESTATRLVFATDADGDSGEFVVSNVAELTAFLTSQGSEAAADTPAAGSTLSPVAADPTADEAPSPTADTATMQRVATSEFEAVAEAKVLPTPPVTGSVPRGMASRPARPSRPHRTKISLSPREIQDRIRHGFTIAELAYEADTDESRIEPYAFPILQERDRIATLARASYPAGPEGINKLTLWEVLATSFAARGESLAQSSWDAWMNDMRQWVVSVSWNKQAAGQVASHVAEFTLDMNNGKKVIAHPANAIASDLIDPRFGQPIRHSATGFGPIGLVSMSGPGEPATAEQPAVPLSTIEEADSPATVTRLPREASPEAPAESDAQPPVHPAAPVQAEAAPRVARPISADAAPSPDPTSTGDDAEVAKPKRRRKPVTPHWEDVLLGVRTTPKKKR